MLWFKQNSADIVQLSEGNNINLITIPHAEVYNFEFFLQSYLNFHNFDQNNAFIQRLHSFGSTHCLLKELRNQIQEITCNYIFKV
jgi:hypothetical protein